MSAPSFRAGGSTTIGVHPNAHENCDYLLLDNDLGLFAVFDAGGSWCELRGRSGRIAAEAIQGAIANGRSAVAEARATLSAAFCAADEALRAETDECGWHGGAAVALALLRDGRVHVSWLGDAMAYRVTGDFIEALTRPHTVWEEMVRRGNTPTNPNFRSLLVHSLGAELPDPLEIVSFEPQPGDRLVLTTDGVTNHIPDSTILNACRVISDPTRCAEAIIEHAIMTGSRDNCSCAVIAFSRPGGDPPPEPPPTPPRKWWQFWK